MKKVILAVALLAMSSTVVMANHHVATEDFEEYKVEQSQTDTVQNLYSAHLGGRVDAVESQMSIFAGEVERLDGTIAINAANSSIYMAANDGLSIGVGVGGYGDSMAVSGKVAYIDDYGSAISFNIGVSDADSNPVVGLGVSHSFY